MCEFSDRTGMLTLPNQDSQVWTSDQADGQSLTAPHTAGSCHFSLPPFRILTVRGQFRVSNPFPASAANKKTGHEARFLFMDQEDQNEYFTTRDS